MAKKDKEPKDMKERFEWICPICKKHGLAATRADAELLALLHKYSAHPGKKKG